MKNLIVLVICLLGINVMAQENESRQIRKEVQMEKMNDSIVLTIKTIDGDKITEEIFTGEEAEKMLVELEKVDENKIVSSQEVKEEISVEDIDGTITVKVKRTEDGITSEEVFTGEEAQKKIKEIEMRQNAPIKIVMESEKEVKATDN